jgi:hypothetical protein
VCLQERLALQSPHAYVPRRPLALVSLPVIDKIKNARFDAVCYARVLLTLRTYKKPFMRLLCLCGTSILTSPATLAGRTELALLLPPP